MRTHCGIPRGGNQHRADKNPHSADWRRFLWVPSVCVDDSPDSRDSGDPWSVPMTAGKRIAGIFAKVTLVVLAVLLSEVALRLASSAFVSIHLLTKKTDQPWISRDIVDERLGIRGNPDHEEHDSRGFRNDSALDRADIVTLGDSHTYGTSVRSEMAWPHLLSRSSGKSVYNMGLGGWGPTHALEILPLALDLQPEVIVFGLYFGNDFFDDFSFAQRFGMLKDFASEDVLAEIVALEDNATIGAEVGFLFRSGGGGAEAPTDTSIESQARRSLLSFVRDALSDHSRIYGLLRATRVEITRRSEIVGLLAPDFERATEGLTDLQRAFVSEYQGPKWRTILTSRYRTRVMDLTDPRIRVGILISQQTVAELKSQVEEVGSRFVVVLLPTKEFVFGPRVDAPAEHQGLNRLVQDEAVIREDLIRFMTDRKIEFVDPLNTLRESERQPYFENGDGHPNPLGHQLIATELLKFLGPS